MVGLNNIGIPTHFLKRLNMREQLISSCEIIPLEVIVRNFAAGTIYERFRRGKAVISTLGGVLL